MDLEEIKDQIRSSCSDRFRSRDELEAFCLTVWDHVVSIDGFVSLDFYDVLSTIEKADAVEVGTKTGNPDDLGALLDGLHDSLQKKNTGRELASLLMQIQYDNKTSEFQMDKLDIVKSFMEKLPEDSDIIWGVGFDDALGRDIRITLVEGYK